MQWRWWLGRKPHAPKRQVVLYTRQGCHLCEDALAVLENAQKRFDFALSVVDIDEDEGLVALFGTEIPVVRIDGQVRFRGQVNRVLLDRLLRARAQIQSNPAGDGDRRSEEI